MNAFSVRAKYLNINVHRDVGVILSASEGSQLRSNLPRLPAFQLEIDFAFQFFLERSSFLRIQLAAKDGFPHSSRRVWS
jgi:hypothetical protein